MQLSSLATAQALQAQGSSSSVLRQAVAQTASQLSDTALITLRAQLAAQRSFQSDLLQTVYWSLATVFGVAALLVGYSWFSNKRSYEQDRDALRSELLAALQEEQSKLHASALEDTAQARKEVANGATAAVETATRSALGPLRSELQDLNRRLITLEYSRLLAEARYWEYTKSVPSNAIVSYRNVLAFGLDNSMSHALPEGLRGMRDALIAGAVLFIEEAAGINGLMSRLPSGYADEAATIAELLKSAPRH